MIKKIFLIIMVIAMTPMIPLFASGISGTSSPNNPETMIVHGKNLYNKADGVIYGYPSSSFTWTAKTSNNSELSIVVKLLEGKTYTAQRAAGAASIFRIQASATYPLTDGQSLRNINSGGTTDITQKTFTVPTGYPYVIFYVRNSQSSSSLTVNDVINAFQVEQGSTATEYEPYYTSNSAECDNYTLEAYSGTSNLNANWSANTIHLHWYADENAATELSVQAASQTCIYDGTLTPPPASSVPQKTGYTFTGWRVRPKNLFDKENLTVINAYIPSSDSPWTYTSGGYSVRIPCSPNTTYTARYNGNSSQNVLSFASTASDQIPTSTNTTVTCTNSIRQQNPTINTPITITTGANDKWLIVQYNGTEPENSDMANNLQVEKGSTATPYRPYSN